jgi:hypothetical protein
MFPCKLAPTTMQRRAQATNDGSGGSCYHCHYYICKQNKNKIGKKNPYIYIFIYKHTRKDTKGGHVIATRPSLLIVIFFSQPWVLKPYLGVLHEKHVQKHQNC